MLGYARAAKIQSKLSQTKVVATSLRMARLREYFHCSQIQRDILIASDEVYTQRSINQVFLLNQIYLCGINCARILVSQHDYVVQQTYIIIKQSFSCLKSFPLLSKTLFTVPISSLLFFFSDAKLQKLLSKPNGFFLLSSAISINMTLRVSPVEFCSQEFFCRRNLLSSQYRDTSLVEAGK